ncbi:MAG: hypothetical protein IKL65_00255 [Bacilli bacterium]|nr:hypothetical protein [Bacilli bacterium]
METILLIAVVGFICALCFFLGAKVGQKVVRGEEIKTPKISALNPLKMYEEHKEKEEAKKEMDKLEVILGNIEKYDGTERGQEDVPM